VRVDETWVFKRVGDSERQMSGAGFHPPKSGRDTHQCGDHSRARAAFDKPLGFFNQVDICAMEASPKYRQA
jgi:hypothetical protein